jgi:hypothetical protein
MKLNIYFPYFPSKEMSNLKPAAKLLVDELMDKIVLAKPASISLMMMRDNIKPYDMDIGGCLQLSNVRNNGYFFTRNGVISYKYSTKNTYIVRN